MLTEQEKERWARLRELSYRLRQANKDNEFYWLVLKEDGTILNPPGIPDLYWWNSKHCQES